MISFVGAGPGAADLLTFRAARRLADADVVVWAASLVSELVLEHCSDDVILFDSKAMTLEDVTAVFAAHPNATIVRLHSGDPSVYSAIAEQIDWCLAHNRDFEVVPGVSSMAAAAAAAGRELTVPGLSQSVIMTRLADRTRSSVPENESVAAFASIGATMAIFLSAARPEKLREELTGPGSAFSDATPAVIASRVTHEDEAIVVTTIGRLAKECLSLGVTTTVMILVGPALAASTVPLRSHVYSPDYAHSFRGSPVPSDSEEPDDGDVAGTGPAQGSVT